MKKLYRFAVCTLLGSSMMLAQGKRLPSAPGDPPKSGGASQKTGAQRDSFSGGCDGTAPTLIADGSTLKDNIAAAPMGGTAAAYYTTFLKPGHSYSAEVWDPFEQNLTIVKLLFPYLKALDSSCQAISSSDVSGMDPVLALGFNARISWVQPDGQVLIFVNLVNTDYLMSYNYNIQLTDTTLHNPRWTTWSGFNTTYGFMNTTDAAISGVLTVTDAVSGPYPPVSVTIPANGQIFEIISGTGNGSPGLNLPKNRVGFADFAFIGPADAIVGDAYYLNSNATVVVPSSFAPRNYQH